MGILGDPKTNLSTGQLGKFVKSVLTTQPQKPGDPLERHAPLSRYGTTHPIDKGLWTMDRAKEIGAKLKENKAKPHEVLANVVTSQQVGNK